MEICRCAIRITIFILYDNFFVTFTDTILTSLQSYIVVISCLSYSQVYDLTNKVFFSDITSLFCSHAVILFHSLPSLWHDKSRIML